MCASFPSSPRARNSRRSSPDVTSTPELSGRVALVTGASRGIGYHIAKQLAAAGAHVIAVARTVGGLEELDDEIKAEHARTGKGEATLVPLDLADMKGIDRIGVLGVIAPIGHVEAKVFEKVMTLNVTATWRLIRSLDPLLRAADAGRAIVLSSGAAHSARAYWGPYAASKAAVEALARSWADETKNTPLRVNIVNPGVARTAMRAQAMPGEDPDKLPHPAEVAAQIVPLAGPDITETGKIWDVELGRFTAGQKPH